MSLGNDTGTLVNYGNLDGADPSGVGLNRKGGSLDMSAGNIWAPKNGGGGGGGGSRGSGAMKGAASGASIGSEIYPGWGTVIGAVAGAVGGYLSANDQPGASTMGANPTNFKGTGLPPSVDAGMADLSSPDSSGGGFTANPYQPSNPQTPQPASMPPPVPSPTPAPAANTNPPAVTPPNPWLTGMAASAPVLKALMSGSNDQQRFMQNAPAPNLAGGKPVPVSVGAPLKRGPSPIERYMMTLRR